MLTIFNFLRRRVSEDEDFHPLPEGGGSSDMQSGESRANEAERVF